MAPVSSVTPDFASLKVRLDQIGKPGRRFEFVADQEARAEAARTLGVVEMPSLKASLEVTQYLDGAALKGDWSAEVVQTCGVSLDPFPSALAGAFLVRMLPANSPNAPETDKEVLLDPDGEDPPDVMDGDTVDVGAYLIEHLSLAVDPFPRKPGVEFEAPAAGEIISPFAVLRGLTSGSSES